MDEFAQSREDNDLFADEFEPILSPTVIADTPTSHVLPHASGPQRTSHSHSGPGYNNSNDRGRRPGGQGRGDGRGQGEARGRGQDRRGGGGQKGRGGAGPGLASSRFATEAASAASEAEKASDLQPKAQLSTDTNLESPANATLPPTDPTSSIPPPSQSTNTVQSTNNEPEKQTRTTAVRGDRSATGGPAHKKLTEEELTEKLEKMKILNAKKVERFRLSEADSAAFAMREKELAAKRIEEQKATRHQDMERAKNRQRKLQAQGGREWDSEKVESDIVDGKGRGRSSEYVRGGHGGVMRGGGLGGSRFADEPQLSRGRGTFESRGRGNRGRGGGGRGEATAPALPKPEDFPSLPSASAVKSPVSDKAPGDWAEEMATPVDPVNPENQW
jgi:hypothetical protein